MIRSLRLGDAATLLLFLGNSPVEEARVRGSLGDRGWEFSSVIPLLRSCLISGKTERSYVCVSDGRIRGLVCIRTCSGPGAWEISRLLLAPGHGESCIGLLEGAGTGGEVGPGRLFLRLDSNRPAVEMSRRAGFTQYLTEFLYRLERGSPGTRRDVAVSMRPKSGADDYKIFRLYSSTVPLPVRTVEGMTYQEWQESRDRGAARVSVVEEGGDVKAAVRIRREGMAGQFDIVGDLAALGAEDLVDCSLSLLHGASPISCLVPEFQDSLARVLEGRGFRPAAEYSCLSRQLAERVREPQLVPLKA